MPKRGLIILVVVWSVLLFLPAFKMQTRSIVSSPFSGDFRKTTSLNDLLNDDPARGLHSDNPQLVIAELQNRSVADVNRYWRDWEAFLANNPDNLNARRARLVAATRKGSLVRSVHVPDELGTSRPLSDEDKRWQDEAQRAATARAARVGEKLAPGDSFFPWMEAMALWNRDDEAALQALARAAKDSGFDDGVMANARALLKAREEKFSMSAVEKLANIFSALLPHYSEMRQLSREVTWSGIEHYRRGDKAGAYRRWRIAIEAGGAMKRGQSHGPQANLIGLYVAQASQRLVWETVAGELNAPARVSGRKPSEDELLRAFEALARRDGQSDLAAYAARENESFEARKFRDQFSDVVTETGLYSPPTQAVVQLPLAGRPIFWLGVAGALALLACLIWRSRVGGAHWPRASAPQIAFFGALWVGALTLAVWARAVDQSQEFGGVKTPLPLAPWLADLLDLSWLFWLCLAATLLIAVALCYWQNAREQNRLRQQILPRDKAATAGDWLPKLVGICWVFVLISTLVWFSTSSGNTNDSAARAVWIVCCAVALSLTLWQIERGQVADKSRSRLALGGATYALVAMGLNAQFGQSPYLNNAISYFIGLCFLAAVAIALYLIAGAKLWRAQAPAALAVALQTLGGVAALCAVAFLLASCVALPVRARQNRVVDDYIKRGEIDWMRAQAGFSKASEKS